MNTRRQYSLHFPGSNPHDAAFRRLCIGPWPDLCRQTACGSKGRQVRSLTSVPFPEMKRVTPDLDQIAALQRPHPHWLAGNKDRAGRVQEGLRSAQLDPGMLRKNGSVFEQINIGLLIAADGGDRF